MRANRTALVLAALAYASGALAQTTSTTMDMGGGMTHVDTMGPNGAMSSSNCMSMGGGMTNCQTMDMSQPHRSYPTSDMSRQQRTYAREPEPDYLVPYVSRSNSPISELPETRTVSRTAVAPPSSPEVSSDNLPVTPAPMTLLSISPASEWSQFRPAGAALNGSDKNDTEYKVVYLGHVFSLEAPKGLSIQDVGARLNQAWDDDPWINYSSTPTGTIYYFSIKSEHVYSDRVEVWTKADHSHDRTIKSRSTMALFDIRCNGNGMRELKQVQYDSGGKVLLSFNQPEDISRVIPDTVGSDLFDEICKYKSGAL